MIKNVKNMIKNFKFITNILLFCAIEYVIYLFSKRKWSICESINNGSGNTEKDKKKYISAFCSKLASKNILFVKMFQAIALNKGIISDETNNELLSFTDNAPWDYDDIDWETIYSLQENDNICFTHGHQPINSGMISLVFRGEHKKTKESLIIKMKKKNIEAKLDAAIDEVIFLMVILSCIPMFKSFEIEQLVSKNFKLIKQQTNFKEEIDNTKLIKNNCKNLKYVKIPQIHEEYTKIYPNIIVMEFIVGTPITKVHKNDYEEFAKCIMKFSFFTLLVNGTMHGDLHAGNILFIKNETNVSSAISADAATDVVATTGAGVVACEYQIGVIDFGVLCKVDDEFKHTLFDLFADMLTLPPREVAIKIVNSGMFEPKHLLRDLPPQHFEYLIDIISDILKDVFKKKNGATQFKLYDAIFLIKTYLNKNKLMSNKIKFSDNFVKIQMSMAMAHGVTLKLCDYDCIEMSNNVFNDMFHTQLFLER